MTVQDVNVSEVNGVPIPVDPANVPKTSLSRYGITFYAHNSAAETGPEGKSSDQFVQNFSELLLLINIQALSGIGPTIVFIVDTKDQYGNYYPIYTSPRFDHEGQQLVESIGAGCSAPIAFGSVIRLRWEIADQGNGVDVPSATFQASIIGK